MLLLIQFVSFVKIKVFIRHAHRNVNVGEGAPYSSASRQQEP